MRAAPDRNVSTPKRGSVERQHSAFSVDGVLGRWETEAGRYEPINHGTQPSSVKTLAGLPVRDGTGAEAGTAAG
jgi:hypothetical protein